MLNRTLESGKKTRRIAAPVLAAVGAMFLCTVAQGSVIVDSSYFSGSRTTDGTTGSGNGLIWNPAAGNWSRGAFSIAWQIALSGSDYTYTYTVTTPENAYLSHWILELSPVDAEGESLEKYWKEVFLKSNEEVGSFSTSNSNPGMPSSGIFGVKFESNDTSSVVVTFTTPQVPVWGDFYAKDGGGTGADAVYAYNIGFGTNPTVSAAASATDFTNWIARPDGQNGGGGGGGTPVPEPATLGLLGLGMLAMGAIRRRKVALKG